MFEKASRLKLRFQHKGQCSVEDLWDMPLRDLDSIFKNLNALNKSVNEESLLETRSKEDEIVSLKIQIVRHIVAVRLQEQKERENLANKAAQKQKILGIIAKKQDEQLEGMSVEDLTKMVEGL